MSLLCWPEVPTNEIGRQTMTTEIQNTEVSPTPRRGRKRAGGADKVRIVSKLPSIQERQYEATLEAPEVKTALFAHEAAQARRDSISRKLCGGSAAVTVDDLARSEEVLANATDALRQLVRHWPILERHPVIASVVARA